MIILYIIVLFSISQATESDIGFDGPNVCRDIKFVTSVGFEDSNFTNHRAATIKTFVVPKPIFTRKCCHGYKLNLNTTECKCECFNGIICIKDTEECECAPGWIGNTCNKLCENGFYGKNCSETCNCSTNFICDPQNGSCICINDNLCNTYSSCLNGGNFSTTQNKCICAAGWNGTKCEQRCGENYYGVNCAQVCKCKNRGSCNAVNGECKCPPGYSGNECERTCIEGFFGNYCRQNCDCRNITNSNKCNPESGKCICNSGRFGENCENKCANGFYGENCKNKCNCSDHGTCEEILGNCVCDAGWIGNNCENKCPNNFYGINCSSPCNCNYGCHHETGCNLHYGRIYDITITALICLLLIIITLYIINVAKFKKYKFKYRCTLRKTISDDCNNQPTQLHNLTDISASNMTDNDINFNIGTSTVRHTYEEIKYDEIRTNRQGDLLYDRLNFFSPNA